MNIYLLNTTSLGVLSTKILKRQLDIRGIICLDNANGSKTSEYYNYEPFCIEHNIDFIGVESYALNKQEDVERIGKLDIDLLLVLSWQRLIPTWFIEQCKIGAVGLHGSAGGITNGRGRSPQNWALLLGEPYFYISLFWIDSEVDSGEIIETKKFKCELVDDIETSYIKSNLLMVDMIVDNIHNGRIALHEGEKQQGEVGYLPQRIEADGMIDWTRSSREIYNFVRALTLPYPCAFTKFNEHCIKIIRGLFIEVESNSFIYAKEGEIVALLDRNHILVKCGQGLLEITEYINIDRIELQEGNVFESASYSIQMNQIIERHQCKTGLKLSSMILNEKG